jgi:hypothetical protein
MTEGAGHRDRNHPTDSESSDSVTAGMAN